MGTRQDMGKKQNSLLLPLLTIVPGFFLASHAFRLGLWPKYQTTQYEGLCHVTARLTGRTRGRAGRQNAGNFPAQPTSLFSPQSARGAPRHVGCSALSTTSARSRALCCGFSYKNFAGLGRSCDRAESGKTQRSLASKPMRGDKMRVFSRLCARFLGWLAICFFARKRFWRIVLQLFR